MTRLAKDVAQMLAQENKRIEWSPTIQAVKWYTEQKSHAQPMTEPHKTESTAQSSKK